MSERESEQIARIAAALDVGNKMLDDVRAQMTEMRSVVYSRLSVLETQQGANHAELTKMSRLLWDGENKTSLTTTVAMQGTAIVSLTTDVEGIKAAAKKLSDAQATGRWNFAVQLMIAIGGTVSAWLAGHR